jgi:hypothetical protein
MPAGNAANVPPLKGRTTPAVTPQGRRQIPLKGPAPSKSTPKEAPKKETASKKKQKVKAPAPSAADAAAATAAKQPKDLKMKKKEKTDAASGAAADTAAAGKAQGDVWGNRLRNAALLGGGVAIGEGGRRLFSEIDDYSARRHMSDYDYGLQQILDEGGKPQRVMKRLDEYNRGDREADLDEIYQKSPHLFEKYLKDRGGDVTSDFSIGGW